MILARRLSGPVRTAPADRRLGLDYLGRAQRGNLTLSKRPFIGAGDVHETWPSPRSWSCPRGPTSSWRRGPRTHVGAARPGPPGDHHRRRSGPARLPPGGAQGRRDHHHRVPARRRPLHDGGRGDRATTGGRRLPAGRPPAGRPGEDRQERYVRSAAPISPVGQPTRAAPRRPARTPQKLQKTRRILRGHPGARLCVREPVPDPHLVSQELDVRPRVATCLRGTTGRARPARSSREDPAEVRTTPQGARDLLWRGPSNSRSRGATEKSFRGGLSPSRSQLVADRHGRDDPGRRSGGPGRRVRGGAGCGRACACFDAVDLALQLSEAHLLVVEERDHQQRPFVKRSVPRSAGPRILPACSHWNTSKSQPVAPQSPGVFKVPSSIALDELPKMESLTRGNQDKGLHICTSGVLFVLCGTIFHGGRRRRPAERRPARHQGRPRGYSTAMLSGVVSA